MALKHALVAFACLAVAQATALVSGRVAGQRDVAYRLRHRLFAGALQRTGQSDRQHPAGPRSASHGGWAGLAAADAIAGLNPARFGAMSGHSGMPQVGYEN